MNFVKCRRLVTLLLYCGAAVLMIVNGQSTPADDADTNENAELANSVARVAKLEGHLEAAVDKIAKLESSLAAIAAKMLDDNINNEEQRDTTYTRWGRRTCQANATLVYQGYAAGPHHSGNGGGSNFLCLPEDPQWNNYIDGHQRRTGSIHGVEYELFNTGGHQNSIFSEDNSGDGPLLDKPAPCAVCYVAGRSTILMVPARTQCPDGWTTEYAGYIVSESSSFQRLRSTYICWDEAPEVAVGGINQNQAVIYPVEVQCGSLPCSVYISGRELTCVVCSK